MNEYGTTVLTIVLSAIVGYIAAVHVEKKKLKHRLRIENEYKILMRLWEKAYWVKSRVNNLRPEHGKQADTEEEKHERLGYFAEAMGDFKQEMYLKKPFYPQQIYCLLEKLKLETYMEARDYGRTPPEPFAAYWDKASQNATKINDLVNQICDKIRNHIHHG